MAAGCVFISDTHVLAGAQMKTGRYIISGFGGSKTENETPIHNAFRETLEEMFHIYPVDTTLVQKMIDTYIPIRVHYMAAINYSLYVFTFQQLETMLVDLQTQITSCLYTSMPLTVPSLVFDRKIVASSEIKQLSIIPLIPGISLDKYFSEDIALLTQK